MKGLNMLRGLTVFVVIVAISAPTNAQNRRKLDENTLPVPPGSENCGGCSSCNNPCNQLPPPSPPSPKNHPSKHYPPPPPPPPPSPPSSFVYISGPPGNLYPVHQYFSGTGRSFAVGLPLWIGMGLLVQLPLW